MLSLKKLMKEYSVFRSNCGYYRLKGYFYRISQRDGKKLNDFVTQDILYSNINSCSFGFFLATNGQVLAQVNIYKLQDRILLQSNCNLSKVLNNCSIPNQDISSDYSIVQIEGQNSPKIANKFYKYDIQSLKFMHMVISKLDNHKFILARFGYSGEFGYQFIVSQKISKKFITKYLKSNNVEHVDPEVVDYTNYEVLQPIQHVIDDNRGCSLFELNYGWPINLLSNFNGKQALEHKVINDDRVSIGFVTTSSAIKVGDPVFFDTQKIGSVDVIFRSLKNPSKFLGGAILNKEFAYSGLKLLCHKSVIKTISAPYVNPLSWNKNN